MGETRRAAATDEHDPAAARWPGPTLSSADRQRPAQATPPPAWAVPVSAMDADRAYHSRRARDELAMAARAIEPTAVRAHLLLHTLHLQRCDTAG